jgi:hypothetical protein
MAVSHWCEDCDPLLAAPKFECGECGARPSPVDGNWITETQILVTYTLEHRSGCSRWGELPWTILADLTSAEGVASAPADNADRAWRHYRDAEAFWVCDDCVSRPDWCDEHRCRAITRAGHRCGAKGRYDGLCGTHRGKAVG